MTIKKAYVELIQFLESNSAKKVSTILEEAKAMCEAKNSSGSDNGKTVLRDEEGNVVAIFCYYHKKWEPLCDVEYGAKKSTSSGYNTMCKEGVSNWTKQQRRAKVSKESLLEQLSEGTLDVNDLPQHQELIEDERTKVISREDTVGFDTVDTCQAYLDGDI